MNVSVLTFILSVTDSLRGLKGIVVIYPVYTANDSE